MPVLKNAKHERFAQQLAAGKSTTEAYELAGFSPNRSNANSLRRKQHISTRVTEILTSRDKVQERALERAVEKTAISKEWVIERLVENAERAMQARPVIIDGEQSGEFRYEGTVANRALELLGKELGMFIDRKEVGGPGEFARMSEDELNDFIASTAAEVGISAPGKAASGRAAKANGSGRPH